MRSSAENDVLRRKISFRKGWLAIDVLINGIDFIIAITSHLPAMTVSVLLVALYLTLPAHERGRG